MKKHHSLLFTTFTLFATLAINACSKKTSTPTARVIQYVLYTDQDFSHVVDTIRFRLFMASGVNTIFDSSLAPMTVAAVPDSSHALVFRKTVPAAYAQSKLAVGFLYQIDNVGSSWFIDSSAAGQTFKSVVYDFR